MKNKIILLLCILTCTFACLTGCSKENIKENNTTTTRKEYTLETLKKDLLSLDNNTKITKMAADMIGAEEGLKFVTQDCSIEVYKFDIQSEDYKKALANQEFYLEDFDTKYTAIVKNGYGYSIDEEKNKCEIQIEYIEKLTNN